MSRDVGDIPGPRPGADDDRDLVGNRRRLIGGGNRVQHLVTLLHRRCRFSFFEFPESGRGQFLHRIGIAQCRHVGHLALLGAGGHTDQNLVAGVDGGVARRVGLDDMVGRHGVVGFLLGSNLEALGLQFGHRVG